MHNSQKSTALRVVPATLALLIAGGCATTGTRTAGDPWEGFNRGVWGFNQGVDKAVLKPVSTAYRTVAPKPVRRGFTSVLSNLSEPFSAINNLLQGKPDRAWRNLKRFVVNTTIGVGGLADHATDLGVAPAPEDFGQTLGSWGVKTGPYLVLPLLGPSSLRDGVGTGVGFVADPYQIGVNEIDPSTPVRIGIIAGTVINTRANLTESGVDSFLASSLDPYAAARSAYIQRRQLDVLNQGGGGGGPPAAGADAGSPSDDAALDAALKEIQNEQGDAGTVAPGAPATGTPPAPPSSGSTGDPSLDAALGEIRSEQQQSQPQASPAPPQPN